MGLLLKMMEQLRDDMERSEETARESRARLHQRIDDVLERIGKIETSVEISGQIDAQVRTELDGLSRRLTSSGDVGATVEAWADLMKTGRRISWVLGVAGVTTAGGFIALISGLWDQVRGWLRLP